MKNTFDGVIDFSLYIINKFIIQSKTQNILKTFPHLVII